MILYRPIKPFTLLQGFGSNPDYYARFKDVNGNPLKGHMGNDLYAVHGTPVYASHDGTASTHTDSHGGEGVYVAAPGYTTIYWHLIGDTDPLYPMPFQGAKAVTAGDLIGYADNTGAPFESTGTHLHFGLYPMDAQGNRLYPANGFDGCIDPAPFTSGTYAQNVKTLVGLYQKAIPLLESLLKGLQGK